MLPLLSLLFLAPPADSLMAPGVSRALAVQRAAQIRNVRYDLALNVTRRDTALGTVRVRFTRAREGDVILDFRGYALTARQVNGTPVPADSTSRAPWTTTSGMAWNGNHLRIPAPLLRDGTNELELGFAAPIAPSGASIIRFTDDRDGNDYLYTLLVPSDANLLFPCFDQPDLKAVFGLELTVRQGWNALSNGPVTQRRLPRAGSNEPAVFTFAPSKLISTYLFAFAAGPYAILRPAASGNAARSAVRSGVGSAVRTGVGSAVSTAVSPDSMTIWVRQSRAREVDVDTLVALNRRAKDWLADYFGIPYPFGKFDMLLAPAFPFGGMEHPGAIFYNEEAFIFREPPTLVQRLGRQATINHEVAHQWFGDYTTMQWFDDLWLKEGFSTYMAAKMQAASGDRTAWMSFHLRNKPPAYDVDASLGTTPVWQDLGNLDQAKSNYGPIVYNKAPSVLKQLDFLVGESAFRRGVHDFLAAHAYGNATWRELLDAIGRAAGRDLTGWGQAYFLRAGMPVVEQHLDTAGGRIRRLTLVQRPAQSLSGGGAWPLKVEVRLQYDGRYPVLIPVEMAAETTVVAHAAGLPVPNFVYANSGDHGYSLVLLDPFSRDWLLTHRVQDAFLRAMTWGSLWDLVRDARLDPARFVGAALAALAVESDEQIASRLMNRVARAMDAYVDPARAEPVRPRAESLFVARAADTAISYGLRKGFFDTYVSIARSPSALARLDAWLDSASAAGMPLRQPTRWSIVTALMARGATGPARLLVEMRRDTSSGGRRRAFIAGAALPDPVVKQQYFERYLRDSTLNEEWVTASLGAFNTADQASLTIPYLRPALDTLPWIQRNRRIFFLGSWLGAFLGGQGSPEALAEVDRYLAERPELPRDLRLKVLQARDDLDRTVRIRRAF